MFAFLTGWCVFWMIFWSGWAWLFWGDPSKRDSAGLLGFFIAAAWLVAVFAGKLISMAF